MPQGRCESRQTTHPWVFIKYLLSLEGFLILSTLRLALPDRHESVFAFDVADVVEHLQYPLGTSFIEFDAYLTFQDLLLIIK
jgi:hypothetical protein